MLKPSLQLKLGQQLTMTPQLQQAIRLLQLPALELQAHIRELLETNVMLEPLEEPEGTGTFETILTAAEQPTAAERAAESSAEVLEEGWGEHSVGPADRPWNGDDDERQQEYADSSGESLQDHLLWQLELASLAPRELAIARAIVDAVSDDGYLTESLEEIGSALALVRSCHPRPGATVSAGSAEYVVPDVFVRRTEHGWGVEINPATLPRVRLNQSYASLIGRNASHATMRAQLQEARWLLKSLEIRHETLMKVARSIVERQTAFLEHGEEHMRPMILKDIAEAVTMHESTISRVTSGKYMHTPRGVFELRYFFSSQVEGADGSGTSSTAIRAKIRKLVKDEDPEAPLSDGRIAELLSAEGIPVARRTVAKYREAMRIVASNERRRTGPIQM